MSPHLTPRAERNLWLASVTTLSVVILLMLSLWD